jgi:GINS complex subunit 4
MMDIDFDLSSFSQSREETSSIHRLQRAWISERSAPDILPYESRLLESISTRLKEQVSTVDNEY